MDDNDSIVIPSALNVLIGVWLTLSPVVVGYEDGDPVTQTMAGGALIATLATLRAFRVARAPLLSWVNCGLGVWLLFVGLFAAASPAPATCLAFAGGLTAVFGAISARTART